MQESDNLNSNIRISDSSKCVDSWNVNGVEKKKSSESSSSSSHVEAGWHTVPVFYCAYVQKKRVV